MLTDSGPGHGTVAESYDDGVLLHLQFSRDTQGVNATFTMNGGTLGVSEGLDFNTWLTLQDAAASPPASEIIYVSDGVAAATDAISSAVGETLTWTADSDAGSQTYRTEGLMTVSALGGGTVDIDGVTYAADDAATLVEAVNSSGSADYFAWLEGTDTVHIVSKGTGSFVIDNPTANVVLSGDAANLTTITTLSDMNSIIDSGVQATGMLHLADGALPLATDTRNPGRHVLELGRDNRRQFAGRRGRFRPGLGILDKRGQRRLLGHGEHQRAPGPACRFRPGPWARPAT